MREVVCSDPACKWSGQHVEHVSEVLNTCPTCKAGTLFSSVPLGEPLADLYAKHDKANHRDIK